MYFRPSKEARVPLSFQVLFGLISGRFRVVMTRHKVNFCKLEGLFVVAFKMRALLFRVNVTDPDCWRLPNGRVFVSIVELAYSEALDANIIQECGMVTRIRSRCCRLEVSFSMMQIHLGALCCGFGDIGCGPGGRSAVGDPFLFFMWKRRSPHGARSGSNLFQAGVT